MNVFRALRAHWTHTAHESGSEAALDGRFEGNAACRSDSGALEHDCGLNWGNWQVVRWISRLEMI